MKLRDLMEQRGRIVADMRGITEKPLGDGGDLNAEQAQRFDTLKTELTGLEKRIERQGFLDEAERRASGLPVTGTGDHQLDTEMRSFSLVKAIAAASGLNVDAGREKELSAELERRSGRKAQGIMCPYSVMERRVLTTAAPAGGPGSNIITTDYKGELFIDRLRAKMVVRRLGARVLTGLVGNLAIPGLKASASAAWVGENAALTPSDPEYRQVTMTPKHAGGIVEMSRNMLMQSSPDVESLVRDDLAKILAEAVDRVAIDGGGTNEPDGILQVATTKTHDMATPSWSNLLALIGLVEDADAEGTAFLAHPAVFRKFQQTYKNPSAPEVGYIMTERGTLAGYTAASSTMAPTVASPASGSIIFGNFSEMVLGFWSELDILVNPFESTAYAKGNVQVRAMMTCDLAVRHAESFAASQNAGL
jgi:HK97 family phage major capsid protein